MGQITHIEDQFSTTVEPRILEQYRDSERWQACLKAVVEQLQVTEDAAVELSRVLDFKTEQPAEKRLDWIASLINLKRMPGEGDVDFYSRFLAAVGDKSAGTPDNVIYNAAILSGDTRPQLLEEADCTFMVYTGPRNYSAVPEGEEFDYGEEGVAPLDEGENQLYASQVRKMAPCGCLGLVGAAIQFEDGSLLGDEQGRLILATADDSTVVRTMVLADDNNRPIITPQNVPVRAVIKGETVPTIPVSINGHQYDAVRIKDLPDAGTENGYMVRDSETEGTRKTNGIGASGMKALWDATEPDEE